MGILTSALPRYSGPYNVGLHDMELSLDKPKSFGTTHVTSATGGPARPAFSYDTVLFSLFYPCEKPTSRWGGSGSGRGVYWLDRSINESLSGWLKFAGKTPQNRFFSSFLLFVTWCLGARLYIPAYKDAPFLDPSLDERKKEKYPLVVFSHGLAGNRRVYSQFCGELASRGYVVAALEHRDGTAPTTSIFGRDGKRKSRLDYITYDEAVWPGSDGKLEAIECRAEQVTQRVSEVSDVVSALRDLFAREDSIDSSRAFPGQLNNLRSDAVDFSRFRGKVDTQPGKIIMTGHSFGSATVLEVLKDRKVKYMFERGICLDPWVDPLGAGIVEAAENGNGHHAGVNGNGDAGSPDLARNGKKSSTIDVPLLIQNSERFTLWDDHFAKVKNTVQNTQTSEKSYLMTICKASHTSYSDFELLRPTWLLALQRRKNPSQTMNPRKDMATIVAASLEFLQASGVGDGKQSILSAEVDESNPKDIEKDEKSGKRSLGGRPGDVILHYRG